VTPWFTLEDPCPVGHGGEVGAVLNDDIGWQFCTREPTEKRPLVRPAGPASSTTQDVLSFTPDRRWLVSAHPGGQRLFLWDTALAMPCASVLFPDDGRSFALSPAGDRLAVCAQEKTFLYSLVGGTVRRSAANELAAIRHFALSTDCQQLATIQGHKTGIDRGLSLYRRVAGRFAVDQEVQIAIGQRIYNPLVGFGGSGSPMVFCLDDNPESPWDRDLGRAPHRGEGSQRPGGRRRWRGVGGCQGWDVAALVPWQVPRVVYTPTPAESRAGFAFNTLLLARGGAYAGGRDGRVIWRSSSGKPGGVWQVFTDQAITSLALRGDGAELLAGGGLGSVARVDLASGQVNRLLGTAHASAVVGVAYLPGTVTLTASADRSIRLWDGTRPVLTLWEEAPLEKVALSRRGELFTLGLGEWGVWVWDLAVLRESLAQLGIEPGFALPSEDTASDSAARETLVAELFRKDTFERPRHRRRETQIDLSWDEDRPVSPWLAKGDFSVRWTGWLQPPRPGRWEFQAEATGAVSLWVDGRPVFEDAGGAPGQEGPTAAVTLPDRPVSLRLDFKGRKGPGHCRLLWRDGDGPFKPVPPSGFHPAPAPAPLSIARKS
jgi:hypothetical protein